MAANRRVHSRFLRLRFDVDEGFGDVLDWLGGGRGGFAPPVDVFHDEQHQRVVVLAELAGVDPRAVSVVVHGRRLVISGERPLGETPGAHLSYQQVEIERGRFRRLIELGADVEARGARAAYVDGMLRIELPLRDRSAAQDRKRVAIKPAGRDGGERA